MLKVGITGGIGSGKTTVCRFFETLGISVYYADERGRELMHTDQQVIAEVKKLFGEDAYTGDTLNSSYISGQAFKDKSLLKQLNAIVHPAVFRDSMEWFKRHSDQPYVLYEAAIMFETGSNKFMDKMITVVAPLEDRIRRTMLRDSVSREHILERVDKQLPDEEKIKHSDFVIHNDHSEPLIEQVMKIHVQLLDIEL